MIVGLNSIMVNQGFVKIGLDWRVLICFFLIEMTSAIRILDNLVGDGRVFVQVGLRPVSGQVIDLVG